MNILYTLAQSYNYDYYDSYSSPMPLVESDASAELGLAVVMFIWFFMLIFIAATYVIVAVSLMKIFKKAGVPSWAAWVPFYNSWKLLEIGGQQGFWAVLAIIPIVNIASSIFVIIAQYHIGKKLGKGSEFVLWAIFVPIVWFIWLAFDKSTWDDKASTAPSLHKA